MWMILPRKIQLTIIVTATLLLAIGIQAVVEWTTGHAPSALKLSSIIVFSLTIILVGIFNFAWRPIWRRFPILAKIIFPDLNGTWKGTLHSNWKDPKTGFSPGPIDTTVRIRQSLLSIRVEQQTKESPSWSTRMFVEADIPADRYRLWYSYDNRPHANVAAFSPDHEGVCSLEMNLGLSNKSMKGQYYTSRSTAGNLNIERVSTELKDLGDRLASGSSAHDFRNEN